MLWNFQFRTVPRYLPLLLCRKVYTKKALSQARLLEYQFVHVEMQTPRSAAGAAGTPSVRRRVTFGSVHAASFDEQGVVFSPTVLPLRPLCSPDRLDINLVKCSNAGEGFATRKRPSVTHSTTTKNQAPSIDNTAVRLPASTKLNCNEILSKEKDLPRNGKHVLDPTCCDQSCPSQQILPSADLELLQHRE